MTSMTGLTYIRCIVWYVEIVYTGVIIITVYDHNEDFSNKVDILM